MGTLRLPYDYALQYQEANGRQCSPYDFIKREFGEGQAILALRPNGDFCDGQLYLPFDRKGLKKQPFRWNQTNILVLAPTLDLF